MNFSKQGIIALLKDFNQVDVEKFASYLVKEGTATEPKDRKKLKNEWLGWSCHTNESMANLFKRVDDTGLTFDGKHITLLNTGVSFDHVAYKNKMLLAYPETTLEIALVYKDDDFSFSTKNGKVFTDHILNNPFDKSDENIIGGFVVVKNNRGEFLTVLDREEIQKHKSVAKTSAIWDKWFPEMVKKTLMKKACKYHFEDMVEGVNEMDNENIDLEQPMTQDFTAKSAIEAITTIEDLKKYYDENKVKIGKDILAMLSNRKEEINAEMEQANEDK